jgi:hypothetical protein
LNYSARRGRNPAKAVLGDGEGAAKAWRPELWSIEEDIEKDSVIQVFIWS